VVALTGTAIAPLVHSPVMPASWNPLDPQFKVDPYPSYRSLIEEDPFHHSPFGPLVLSRYEDCLTMLRHPAASSDLRKIPGWEAPPGIDPGDITPSFLSLDPPDHTRLRGLVAKAFTPRRAEALRPRMQQIAEQIVEEAAERSSMEVVADLAFPLPVMVICELLGVPPEDVDEFKEWSAAVARTLDPPFLIPEEVLSSAQAAAARAEAYFKQLIAERRQRPSDDLISALIVAEESGDQLSEAEMLSTLGLLLIAGHETSVNLIANGVLAFARHPDQFVRLRDEPGLLRSAVEEILRFDPPVHADGRLALEDIELPSGTVKQWEQPVILLPAANRDPAYFADADCFDIGRGDNRHLSFGFGIHHCLGAPLARAEAQVALGYLALRFSRIELVDDPPSYKDNLVLRGVSSLEVRLYT
jgi:cytochrome P450